MGETDTLSREEAGLFLTEHETAQRLGISDDRWRQAKTVLESQGLPKRDNLMGGRYWPAVKAFFDKRAEVDTVGKEAAGKWEENLDEL